MSAVMADSAAVGCSRVPLRATFKRKLALAFSMLMFVGWLAALVAVGACVEPGRERDLYDQGKSSADLDVTVRAEACEIGCADMTAEAQGGHPPYHFTWEDGSTAPSRRVCQQDEEVRVEVRDTAVRNAETRRPAQAAAAILPLGSLDCQRTVSRLYATAASPR